MKKKISIKRPRANLAAILEGHSALSVAQLNRYAGKYTDCGAWVGALVDSKWLYDIELGRIMPRDVVTALRVGSIVEGVDQTTEVHEITLWDYAKPDDALDAYNEALDAVEREAKEIWQTTHGCESCAEYFGIRYIAGDTPVWEKCPDCEGSGQAI